MRTTIDNAGRVAIPKEVRETLALHGGEELAVAIFDGTIEIQRVDRTSVLKKSEGGLLTFAQSLGLTSAELVREAIEGARRGGP